jgi:hypothetical protein
MLMTLFEGERMNSVISASGSNGQILDPSRGNFVKGIEVGPREFVGIASFAALQRFIHNPADIQPKSINKTPQFAEEIDLHYQVQRLLSGAKKRNLASFGLYIAQMVKGERDGVLPSVTAVCLEPLEVVHFNGAEYLEIPFDAIVLLADGETQIAAFFDQYLDALKRDRELKAKSEYQKKLAEFKIKIVFHHGKTLAQARQYFHDLNAYGVVVSVNQAAAMDTHDPINGIITGLEQNIAELHNKVERQSRQVAKSSDKLVTVFALRQFVVDMAKGVAGVQLGARPLAPGEVEYEALEQAANAWLKALFARYGEQFTKREEYVLSSPAFLAVLGALGQPVYEAAYRGAELQTIIDRQLSRLAGVRWNRGAQWEGVGGKMSPKGLVLGGPKEVAYTVYNALTDNESPNYAKVRA